MKGSKVYPVTEESDSGQKVTELTAVAYNNYPTHAAPDMADFAHVVNGVLQVTPDIEEEIAEVERGETVKMSEFQTMFAKWL